VNNALSIPMGDVMKMAEAVAKSGLFGVKSPEQALALMLVAQAEGRHPALAARDYDIIQGRPAKKTEAMLRDFLENQGKVEWHQLDDAMASATFSHPSGGTVKIDWDIKRASAAGLSSRDMWKKYPRQMLRSRCVSEGIRTVCPMATSGMYVPEEIRDIVEKDVTPATPRSGAKERLTQEQIEKVNTVASACGEFLRAGAVEDAAVEMDNAGLDADEKVYFWDQFNAKDGKLIAAELRKQRTARKALAAPAAPAEPDPTQAVPESEPTINDAQRKRLEARITEVGIARDKVKKYVKKTFGKEHFADMNKAEYDIIDRMLTDYVPPKPATEPPLSARIKSCATDAELDALSESLSEDDAAIFFDAVAKRKSELTEGGGL